MWGEGEGGEQGSSHRAGDQKTLGLCFSLPMRLRPSHPWCLDPSFSYNRFVPIRWEEQRLLLLLEPERAWREHAAHRGGEVANLEMTSNPQLEDSLDNIHLTFHSLTKGSLPQVPSGRRVPGLVVSNCLESVSLRRVEGKSKHPKTTWF